MNVRFFAGTKAQYLSLNTPRNPHALYFCADTHELFWGDRLLSDGIRVVETHADLPSLDIKAENPAADGVVYYVTETRNGYILSPDRSEWLQTIYAPLRKGETVPEGEEDNTVTTIGAVQHIADEIYKYIDEQIKTVSGADLSKLVTKEELKAAIEAIEHPSVDLDNYATKDFVLEQLNKIPEVNLDDYAKKSDIPSVEGLASEKYVDDKIAQINIPTVPTKISELENDLGFITSIPDEFITEDELEAKGYLKEHQDLSDYAKTAFVTGTAVQHKYEVLPFDGALINYFDSEVRVNTQHVDIDSLPKQNAGDGSSDNYYYMTFRAFAPEGATSVIEGQNDKMDDKHSTLAVDKFGRQYTTIWAAIAMKSGNTWIKYGDMSYDDTRKDKYLGFYYNFHWYNEDKLIGMDKVRVILTNDKCHNDLVPDAVARRIDDKVSNVNTIVNNITEQVNNIEQSYVTNDTLVQNYTTTEQLAATYVTQETVSTTIVEKFGETIEETVINVIDAKVEGGEITIAKAESINYDTF